VTADQRIQLPPQYSPGDVEARRYQDWVAHGLFHADASAPGPAYCIVIPPPNVTGSLHMGHALDHTLIDALIRRRRMQGYVTLWLPGMDHAGIATQNVVERELAKQGLSRHDLGREAFVERVWQWKAESGGKILGQMRRLGDSVDWSRERFTMDEGLSRAVLTIFKRLYDDGSSTARTDHQLVPALPHRAVRHRGRARRRGRGAYRHPVRGRPGLVAGRHHPAGDHAGRHRGRRSTPTTPAMPPGRPGRRAAAVRAGRIPVVADPHVDPSSAPARSR
jgi:hypothetical protein